MAKKNFEDMCNRLHTIPACDGRSDRQTSCHGVVRPMHVRRVVKIGPPEPISWPRIYFGDPLKISPSKWEMTYQSPDRTKRKQMHIRF